MTLHIFLIARLITGNGGNPETGPNVVAQEGDSQVKVCIKLSGLTDSSYPEPVEFFFTPMEKSEALQPAQGIELIEIASHAVWQLVMI